MAVSISAIFKNAESELKQFSQSEIKNLESRITEEKDKSGKSVYKTACLVRGKPVKLTPEEVVRQLYLSKLMTEYGYKKEQMELERSVKMGREEKRADIVIYEDERRLTPYIVVETKAAREKEGKEQLQSYINVLGASVGVLVNGSTIEEYYLDTENKRNRTHFLAKLSYLPKASQTLSDVLNLPFTMLDLMEKDVLQHRTLKSVILEFEDIVLANAGVDSFEEIFKFIFAKLYDEKESGADADRIATLTGDAGMSLGDIKKSVEDGKFAFRQMEFRDTGTPGDVERRLKALFEKAKKKWHGIFSESDTFKLIASDIRLCVSYLQDVKLFNSNLEVVDDAFEYLVNKEQKGDKGQYFTPRYVIDMCVKMLNPKPDETMIDTAAGSCGFPMHTIFHVWRTLNPSAPNLFTTRSRTQKEPDYVRGNVFAIDFDERSVRVGRALNIIAGDGHANVLLLNSLDYTTWQAQSRGETWQKTYIEGFNRLRDLRHKNDDGSRVEDYSRFDFDVLMANPPFAGDITKPQILALYPGMTGDGKKTRAKVGRDILFIERNLNFLKPGGRMAIVLPQGRFNNSSDKYIRDFIAERCRILAVVGLHQNTFKPHTGTKTSVLFAQKWDETLCPKRDDYNIFFATMQESGKDNSGEKIYEKENIVSYFEDGKRIQLEESKFLEKYKSYEEYERYQNKKDKTDVIDGVAYRNCISKAEQDDYINLRKAVVETKYKRDRHGHIFVKQDLYNYEGLTRDGIAEAFAEFAKKEGLSFFR